MTTPPRPKKPRARTARERMSARRKRLRTQGLRPVEYWVPDLRNPRVLAEIQREAALLAQHPDNAALDDWIDAAYDWSEWK
jgi:Protein  of unknown function (DUF3018)